MNTPKLDRKSATQILNSRKLINKVDKFTLRVTSVTENFQREDGSVVSIVNFNAMTQYQLDQAKAHFAAGEYDEAANLNMSSSVLPGRYVPSKGEVVDVEVTQIKNNEDIDILVINTIIPRKAAQAPSISFFTAEDAVEEQEEELVEQPENAGAEAPKGKVK